MLPANADGKPSRLERWAAQTSLRTTLEREAPKGPNPLPLDDANLIAGIKLYAANCAICHGASEGKPSNIALGVYQKPPQLVKDGVEDDPEGVTYWKVAHGIRFTAMPAFGKALEDRQLWQLTLFLNTWTAFRRRRSAFGKLELGRWRRWGRLGSRRRGEDVLVVGGRLRIRELILHRHA